MSPPPLRRLHCLMSDHFHLLLEQALRKRFGEKRTSGARRLQKDVMGT
jgi:hypothetical protein